MKHTIIYSNLIKTVCVFSLSCVANLAMAHSFSGSLNGNAGASGLGAATDYYQLACDRTQAAASESTAPAAKMLISIRDTTAGASLVGVSLSKPDTVSGPNAPVNKKAQTTIDIAGGPTNTVYSPEISVEGGEGIYYATVFHTGTTASDSFAATFHCVDAAGVHSGTAEAVRLSNQ